MISQRLQLVIDSLGWTQERLAREIVTNPSTVSRWFSGNTISKTSVKRISSATGINPAWLLTGQGPMKVTTGESSEVHPEINVAEGMATTKYVLESKTEYAKTLWHNLVSFKESVEKEGEMRELTGKVDALTKLVEELRAELRVAGLPGDHAKKRDKAANA